MSLSLGMYEDEWYGDVSEGMSNDGMYHFAFVCVTCDMLVFDGLTLLDCIVGVLDECDPVLLAVTIQLLAM